RSSHTAAATFAAFDDPNLLAYGGLAPAIRLAERCGLSGLVRDKARLAGAVNGAGTAADAKVMSLIAAMLAGADSIEDTDVLRHGAMNRAFTGMRAPSTLGTFLRAFAWGHVRQLEFAARAFTRNLAGHCNLLPGSDEIVYLDIDSKVKQVYGAAKQGAEHGYTKVRGLHFQIVTASTPIAAPVIVATRLRKGSAGSAKGAAPLISEAITAVRAMGATGMIVVRGDSAFFSHKVVAACRSARVRFSFAVAQRKKIRTTIAAIDESAWIPIKYPRAIFDHDEQRWISDAEVAEIPYTAFTGKAKKYQVTARLLVRRVRRLNPVSVPEGQGELFATWRFHAVFTDSHQELIEAEADHRRHAIVEQVFVDLEDSALGHLPSGKFTANAAWLTLAALAHNLTRATGTPASAFHARARTGTIRRQLLAVPARLATRARTLTWHFPQHWPWQEAFMNLSTAVGHREATRPA
ncbi:IS1380 family transposase, partial [Streptomyces sp. NPDC094438]|uniref:IS1380 family transposase n=1 Tax=Streptomyces sp. NPDC094438 TaxID=3366061 RepID=UPI00382B59FB